MGSSDSRFSILGLVGNFACVMASQQKMGLFFQRSKSLQPSKNTFFLRHKNMYLVKRRFLVTIKRLTVAFVISR
jgi:hypothetical protein